MTDLEADVVVLGSGIAGLSFALKMAQEHDVLLLTKKRALTRTPTTPAAVLQQCWAPTMTSSTTCVTPWWPGRASVTGGPWRP